MLPNSAQTTEKTILPLRICLLFNNYLTFAHAHLIDDAMEAGGENISWIKKTASMLFKI